MSDKSTTIDESDDEQPSVSELVERVEALEKTQEDLKQGAIDAQGRNWSVTDFLNLGLSRRQALSAVAVISGGGTAASALIQVVSEPAAADPGDNGNTTLGSSSNRWDAWMGEIDANTLSTDALSHNQQPPSDVSSTRSFDTEYQNTTDNQLKVIVRLRKPDGTSGQIDVTLDVTPSSGDYTNAEKDGIRTPTTSERINYIVKANVPPGDYYQVASFGDEGDVGDETSWFEMEWA